MKRWGVLAISVATVLALAACGGDGNGEGEDGESGDKPYRMLIIGGFTGPLAGTATQHEDAMTYAAEQVNAGGGIGGRDLVIDTVDSEADPTKAVSKLQEVLAGDQRPDVVVAFSSGDALAMAPVLTREKILSVSASTNPALNDPEAYPYHFSTNPTGDAKDMIEALKAEFTEAGVTSFTAMTSNDAVGEGAAVSIEEVFADSGIDFDVVKYNAADLDQTLAYKKALSRDADALFIDGAGSSVGPLLEAKVKLDPDAEVPTYAGLGLTLVPPHTVAPEEAFENYHSAVLASTVFKPEEERSDALSGVISGLGLTDQYSIFVPALNVDAVRMLQIAAEQGGGTSADEMKAGFESLPAQDEGVYAVDAPDVTYTAEDHFQQAPPEVWAWVPPYGLEDGLWVTE